MAASTVPLLPDRRLVLTTQLDVSVTDVVRIAARVRALAIAAGGYVADEKTSAASGSDRSAMSTIVLRIPRAQLGAVTDQVAALGHVDVRDESSQDVTQQTVDVQSRLETQRASVARVRALLAKATKISEIVAIEGELSQREADLESMQAQLKSLNDATDLSTLTVSLSVPAAAGHHAKQSSGFVAGLHRGWDAFATSVSVALTVLGAALPFLVLAALLGVPALWWWRRHRPTSPPALTAPTEPAGA